jgi:hypothetical protein
MDALSAEPAQALRGPLSQHLFFHVYGEEDVALSCAICGLLTDWPRCAHGRAGSGGPEFG